MTRRYNIEMSNSAAHVYKQLAINAKQQRKGVNGVANPVDAFSCIEDALDEISLTPLNEARALAGNFSGLYRFKSGQVRISYWVAPSTGVVFVHGLCIVSHNLSQFVQQAFESGKLDTLCVSLGIDKSGLEESPRSRYLN